MNTLALVSSLPFHYGLLGMVILAFTLLALNGKLPSNSSIQEFATIINSKGGNILWLGFFSLIFFSSAIGLFYWSMNRIIEGKLKPEDAVLMMALQFVTGSAFGGAFASMLKVMSGENPPPVNGKTASGSVPMFTTSSTPAQPPAIAPAGIATQGNAIPESGQH